MEMIELQNRFAARLTGSVKQPWDEIRVHYENAEIGGLHRVVFTSVLLVHGARQDLNLQLEALDLLEELKQCKPQGQADEWVWLEFIIDKTGKYKFEYKYDNPPLIMEQIKYSQ